MKHSFCRSSTLQVISERNTDSDKCFTEAGEENPFNTQLRNMNIVNELAILNQYYTKNNKDLCRESGDVDSSVSVDGSRTSENKLNDFVDYESSVSADGSRTEENSRDELVNYESSMNNENPDQAYPVVGRAVKAPATSVITNEVSETEDTRLVNNRKENKESVDHEEEKTEEEDENDEEDVDSEMEEQANIEENLRNRRKSLQEQYTKLYDHVLKVKKKTLR